MVTPFFAGQMVADRELVRVLGQGREGQVWEAKHPDGYEVALKLLTPDVLPSADKVTSRGQWLVRIDDPALVTVTRGGRFTSGEYAGYGFVEMELVRGESMQRVGPQPDALVQLAGIARAIDGLHAGTWSDGVPLIHRDIKPGNIIGTDRGLVLVDPSTMRSLDSVELTRIGTPAYEAPEVSSGRFGRAADVYSFAATAAALLTGKRGNELMGLILRAREEDVLPDAIVQGLSLNPGERPSTCIQMSEGVVHTLQADIAPTQTMGVVNEDYSTGIGQTRTEVAGQSRTRPIGRTRTELARPGQFGYGQRRPARRPGPGMAGPGMAGPGMAGGYAPDGYGAARYEPGYGVPGGYPPQGYAPPPSRRPWGPAGESPYGGYPAPVQAQYQHGADYEVAVRTPRAPSLPPLASWAVFSLLALVFTACVTIVAVQPHMAALPTNALWVMLLLVAVIHLIVHAINGRPLLALFAWPYAWGAAYGDTSGVSRWAWVMDTASGWFATLTLGALYSVVPTLVHDLLDINMPLWVATTLPNWPYPPAEHINDTTVMASLVLGGLAVVGGQIIRWMGRLPGVLFWPLSLVCLVFTLIGTIPRWIFRW